jgi:hypothetical protein
LARGVNHRTRGHTPAAATRAASFPTEVKDAVASFAIAGHILFLVFNDSIIDTTLNKRLIGYDPDKNKTPDQLVEFLEEQVQDDLDGASIQEYLATFGMKMI